MITMMYVFKCGKNNSATIQHVYTESANLIESYTVDFDINGPLDLSVMVPGIGIEDIVSHDHLCYMRMVDVGLWLLNSLRPSDAYMHRLTDHHWFR